MKEKNAWTQNQIWDWERNLGLRRKPNFGAPRNSGIRKQTVDGTGRELEIEE